MARRPPAGPDPGPTLFDEIAKRDPEVRAATPLAERMRPSALAEVIGQDHLLGPDKLLARAIAGDRLPSMILWGPPGSGKTTLARVIAETTRARFVHFSAVLGGVPELRQILAEARARRMGDRKRTILFVDEIHRFNKAQQDAFLPHVEDGTITLIGATTENPSFSVNAPLLSRAKVFRLHALEVPDIVALLQRALASEDGFGGRLQAPDDALSAIASLSQGDARRALSTLELAAQEAAREGTSVIALDTVTKSSGEQTLLYDKAGDEHYNVVSAFIKSMRGSDPDGAIYWLMRMLEAGDDPEFLLRRMMIFASEDIGNADPRALEVAVAADASFRRTGMPEGIYPLAQAALYLACAPKSNACTIAWHRAQAAVREHGALEVPFKLRNAVTSLMRQEGYGHGYRYAHDEEEAFAQGEVYLPDRIAGARFYEPTDRGYERTIAERLSRLRGKD